MENTRWLIAGLGNPGKQYEATRHNIGFMVLEALAKDLGISGKSESRFEAIVGSGKAWGKSVVVAQPTTYMNLSGRAIQKLMAYYDIPPENILIIYDEAALPLGRIRIRPKGSAAGHNGIKSIIADALSGSDVFPRLRVGIGTPKHPGHEMKDFVLGKFDKGEQELVDKMIALSIKATESILRNGVQDTMTLYNGIDLAEPASD